MYGYRPRREFLSPLDALDVAGNTGITTYAARHPIPESMSSSLPSPASSSAQDFLPVDVLEKRFAGGLQTQVKKTRRYSDQDLKTRSARAALLPSKAHRSSASYPFYSPSQQSTSLSYAPSPPFLPWGISTEMDPPRLHARPVSPASSWTSFGSKSKSPSSIGSSIEYASSRTSEESSNPMDTKDEFIARVPVLRHGPSSGRRSFVEPFVPTYARVGAGGQGRQQGQTTLMTPQRLKGPPSSTSPPPLGVKYSPRTPGQGFKKLPEEILLVVLAELKKSHLETASLSCSTCWMRDLMNLGLSCKIWWGAARSVLYEDIQLNGTESTLHTKKKFKTKYGARLTLLRRTLRARPDLAQYVKSLKVPSIPDVAKSKGEEQEYIDLVASLIMSCPNLERVPGFYPAYNHEFSRFAYALSTRRRLRERVWVLNPSPVQRQRRYTFEEGPQTPIPILAPGPLLPEHRVEFLNSHMNWSHLSTLFLHCNPGGTIDSLLFSDVFNSLPSLEHLLVSSFPASAFNDSTLISLPPLRSLRLDNLPGISAAGLSNYAAATCSDALTHLSLVSVPLLSLPVLARLFSHLVSLTHFTISQAPSPALPVGVEIYLYPYLASETLRYLHWEFTNTGDEEATDILAKSITCSGFPSLRTLRAPSDFAGTLQKLCKPREKIELPGDRYRNIGTTGHNAIPTSKSMPNMPPSPTWSTFSLGRSSSGSTSSSFLKSSSRATLSMKSGDTYFQDETRSKGVSLAKARRIAQTRIEAASTKPKFHIIIWDENGQLVERFAVGGFVGSISRPIFYSLKPDVDGMDEAVVTIDGLGGLLDGGEETNVKDGCTGSWNLNLEVQGKSARSRSSKERWWHTERGRWKEVPLGKFF